MRAFAIVGLGLAVVGAVGALVVRIVAPGPFLPVTFGFGPAAMIAFITHRTALAATASGAVHPTGAGVWLRPAPGATR